MEGEFEEESLVPSPSVMEDESHPPQQGEPAGEYEETEPGFEVDEDEAQSAGVQKTPMLPSQSEIDEHNLTHLRSELVPVLYPWERTFFGAFCPQEC